MDNVEGLFLVPGYREFRARLRFVLEMNDGTELQAWGIASTLVETRYA